MEDQPTQKPICLITGATERVGKATALELARKGFAGHGGWLRGHVSDQLSVGLSSDASAGRGTEEQRQGRIISLSSSVYTLSKFDPKNLQSEKRFSVMGLFCVEAFALVQH
jgi:hypothetical protein